MADALCGPSNALQNFQKHTTVDRTLQQDRLIGRHSPVQGFRSSPGPNAGALDSEFDAFQAGQPVPQQDFQQFPPQFAPPLPQQFAQAPQLPDWASDFQRLNLSNPPPQPLQHQRPQAAQAWHQDFMRQQAPAAQAPALQQNTFGGMSGYGMNNFAGPAFMQAPAFQNAAALEPTQGKQQAQDAIPTFDDAAFENAFAQAQQDMLEQAETAQIQAQTPALDRSGELDPLLLRIRETRPAVYSAIQVWSETGLGRTDEAVAYLQDMHRLEQTGQLVQDANEAKWIVDSLQRISNRDAPQEVKTQTDSLIAAINQRLMSQYPLTARAPMTEEQIWRDLEAAGYMRTPEIERAEQKPEEQKEEQPPLNDDDEMAATAGRLLERVADDTSEKFQNSQFLSLMRKLRDREVRVQEDKIVDVSEAPVTSTTTTAAAPTSSTSYPYTQLQTSQPNPPLSSSTNQIPPIDPSILSHAATDFDLPTYADQGHEQYAPPSTSSSEGPITDEISDQFRTYNVHGAYHQATRNGGMIPQSEQDWDLWRFGQGDVPGRDPVTGVRGVGGEGKGKGRDGGGGRGI